MKIVKDKTEAIAIALFLTLIMAGTLVALPLVSAGFDTETAAAIAEGMTWPPPGAENADLNASSNRLLLWDRYEDHIPAWVFAVISPNPVGVGQRISIVMFNPQQPPGASAANDIRYTYNVIIDTPDGKQETLPTDGGVFTSDSTGTAYTLYTPDQVGNYTITVRFNELFYDWYGSSSERDYYGVTFDENTYSVNVVVQDEPVIPAGWTTTPLPTEYWTRPIEGQNTEWWRVASNWLASEKDKNNGGSENRYQVDGTAPNSGHILWTKPVEDGGLVGGGNFSVAGEVFNAGHQYQTRFTNPIIMWGRLYYEIPVQWSGGGGGWMCVDLKTGEEIWDGALPLGVSGSGMDDPSFGYYYDLDNMNNHGVVTPGWLFTSNFGASIHPRYGTYGTIQLTNVPSPVVSFMAVEATPVYEVIGPKGESIRYVLNDNGWLAQWNSSKVFDDSETGTIVANVPLTPSQPTELPPPLDTFMSYGMFGLSQQCAWAWDGSEWVIYDTVTRKVVNVTATTVGNLVTTNTVLESTNSNPSYDWNVSAPWRVGMTGGSITIRAVEYGDYLLGSNGSMPAGTNGPQYTYPDEVTFWAINLNPDRGEVGSVMWMKNIQTVTDPADAGEMIFERAAEGVMVFVKLPERRWIGYDIYTGDKLWEAEVAESDFNPFGYFSFPSLIHVASSSIADGKLFTGGYTGAVHCYDLYNGTLLWRYEAPTDQEIFPYYTLMLGAICDGKIYVGTHEHSADTPLFKGNKVRALNVTTGEEVWTMYGWAHPYTFAVADGVLVYWNNYDHQVYAVGKGPTSLTVEAPMAAVDFGSSLVIRGTVMDVSAGTEQQEQAMRFPNGVPAVSDESQSAWMEYVYMQKARPANATGVEVIIDVLDSNGNYRKIGTATSDSSGAFSFQWTPDIPGKYTVIATFAGSESYYGSFAETAFAVDEAPETTPQPTEPPAPATDMYVTGFGIGMIIAVIAVGLVIVLMLRKR